MFFAELLYNPGQRLVSFVYITMLLLQRLCEVEIFFWLFCKDDICHKGIIAA